MPTSCVFCQIVSGQLPAYKIYEDSDFLAFLDIQPVVRGHILVIPKEHHQFFYDVPHAGNYFEVVKKVSLAGKKALNSAYIQTRTLGEAVPHAHVHVLPIVKFGNEKLDWSKHLSFSSIELSQTASAIKSAF